MLQVAVRLIINMLGVFLITYSLSMFQGVKYKICDLYIYSILYYAGYFLLDERYWQLYIIKNIYFVLIFVIYVLRSKMKIINGISVICALLCICEILKIMAGIISGLSVLFVAAQGFLREITTACASILFMSIAIWLLIKLIERGIIKFEFSFFKKCMACFIYFLILCIRIPFLYTDIKDAVALKMVFITIICCTVIFLIISRIERHNAEKERALIEENNKILSTKLHKSQEILPAMVQVFSDVVENGGTEMEGQHAQKLLEEVSDLYGQQLKENSKEDLQLKNFCSTGLKLLDEQLKVYQMEASDRNVNLDIFVQAPINGIMKKGNIDQLKFQRTVGDLVRNAFHALKDVDKEHRTSGHILLIIGCRYEEILEVAVVDNGEYFPLHVIEAFGKRGVTIGGTGNGLADLVEFADETQATICVEEFAWETNSFTKKVSIIFDKQRMNYFNSPRKASVESAFWNKN